MNSANAPTLPTIMQDTPSTLGHLATLPNVLGAARLNNTDGSMEQTGPEAEALANVLGCFGQLAGLVGASFGLERLTEAHIGGRNVSIVCVCDDDSTTGVLMNSRARPAEIAARLRSGSH